MPDKKPTDAEIVKALKQCKDCNADLRNSCNGCLLLNYYPYCTENGIDLGVDLINRLQAENKNLQERNVILRGLVDTQKAENERLKKGWKADIQLTAEVKAEAYKEYHIKARACLKANRDIEQQIGNNYAARAIKEIENRFDNIFKELVGDK